MNLGNDTLYCSVCPVEAEIICKGDDTVDVDTCGELFCKDHGTVNVKDGELHIIKMNHLHEGALSSGLCHNCKIMVDFRNKRKQRQAEEIGFKTFGEATNREIKRDDYILKCIGFVVVAFMIGMIFMIVNQVAKDGEEPAVFTSSTGFMMQNLNL